MAFGNLTVDFRQLSKIPVRDRAELMRSPQASDIFGNMTPSQIAKLVPSYYQNLAAGTSYGAMGGALSGGYSGGGSGGSTAQQQQSDRVKQQGQQQQSRRLPENPLLAELLMAGRPKISGPVRDTSSINKTYKDNKISGLTQEQQLKFAAFVAANFEGGPHLQGRVDTMLSMMNRAKQNHGNYGDMFNQLVAREQYSPISASIYGSSADQHALTVAGKRVSLDDIRAAVASPDPMAALSQLYGRGDKGIAAAEEVFSSIVNQDDYYNNARNFVGGRTDYRSYRKYSSDIERQDSDNAFREANSDRVAAEITDFIESATDEVATAIPGSEGITAQNPTGADGGAIMPLLKGNESAATATAVPGQEVVQRTMVLSLGTNDWDNSASTYQNTLDAIKSAQEKGYKVVVVPPVGGNPKFQKVHDLVVQAANESGASIEQPQSYSPDGYHPTGGEYKRIGEKYPGAVVVGDSIANGIGQQTVGGKTVAKDGMGSSVIRTNVLSDDVPVNTAPTAPQAQTFNVEVFTQLDPRIKELYDKATPENRAKIERAITNLGAQEINNIASKHPTASPQALSNSVGINASDYVEMSNQNAGRYNPIDENLKTKIGNMVADVYGPEYKAVVYSGGEPTSGSKVSDSGRHDVAYDAEGNMLGGQAADVYIVNRETGEAIPREQQVKALQYWQSNQFGGTGLGMSGGGLHLDQIQRGESSGENLSYRVWAYSGDNASQRFLNDTERAAAVQSRSEGFDVNTIAPYKRQREIEAQSKQVVPTPPGTEPVTPAPQQNDTAVIPLEQGQQSATPAPSGPAPAEIPAPEATPNMKLGGVANLVDEQMTVQGADGQGFNFNQNEEVNIKDGKATVQNEYQKQAQETKQKTDTGMPKAQNQGSIRPAPSTNDFQGQAKYAVVPHSPSAQRHFDASRFNDKHFRGNGARNGT
jgi:hypothetical protein